MNCGSNGCNFEDNTADSFDAYETDATTNRTRKNIFSKLSAYMDKTYGKKGITNSLLKLQGISSKDFDYVSSVENFMLGNLSGVSINPNANKCETNMMRVMSEAESPFRKLLGYDLLYRTCKRLYGKEEATRLMNRVYSYDLYVCDSTAIPQVYCWAINGTDLLVDGRNTGALKCSAPQHMFSYISMLCGTIHTLSQNALAGACACGTVFFDSAYLLMKDGYTLQEVKEDSTLRKEIKNNYQNLIYDLSDTTRVAEPPFTNISLFDRPKVRDMVENLSWLYAIEDIHDFEYITDYVMELQDLYVDVFDFGNPLVMTDRGVGDQFEFPVTTVNLTKDANTGEVVDTEFLKKMCKRHIERYNIMTSNGSKVSSCCRLQSDMLELAKSGAINSFGGSGAMAVGSHRVILPNFVRFALVSKTYDEFMAMVSEATEDTAKLLKAHKELLERERSGGLQPYIDAGLINLNKLFSTFGFIGLWETYGYLKENKGNFEETAVDIVTHYNREVKRLSSKYGLMANIEQVPGESIAVKLAKADAIVFGKSIQKHMLYSNQYIPLTEPVDMFSRMEMDGKLNRLVTGGGIVHITSGEYVSPEQAEAIISYASKCGNEFFAINVISSICGECGNVTVGKVKTCKHCGGEIKDYTTRVVGFKTLVSNWIPERKIEFEKRFMCDLGQIDKK